MSNYKFVDSLDIKASDGYALRSRVLDWLDARMCVLEAAYYLYQNARPEEERKKKDAFLKYQNNFALLEHAIRFLCEVGLMGDDTGRKYVNKMYKYVIMEKDI